MPWHILYGAAGCNDDEWAVVKDADGAIEGCHATRADAQSQLAALYAEEPAAASAVTAAAIENDGPQTGAMIAFVPTPEDAQRLALEGYEPADQMHITSVFLGDAAALDDVMRKQIIAAAAQAIAGTTPFTVEAFGVAAFNPEGEQPCLVLTLSGNELADAQAAIEMAGLATGPDAHRPWLAHMTLAYDTDPYLLMGDDITQRLGPIAIDRLRVAFAGEVTDIPLGDNPQAVDEPADEPAMVAAVLMGTPFEAILVPEGVWSGSGRQFAPGALTWADLPIALKWQPAEEEGHEGSVISGRIDEIVRDEASVVRVRGIFDDAGQFGSEALRLARNQFLRGISLCADDIEAADIELVWPPEEPKSAEVTPPGPELDVIVDADGQPMTDYADPSSEMPKPATAEEMYGCEPKEIYHAGRIRSATLVAEPDFAESVLTVLDGQPLEPTRIMVAAADGGVGWTITIPELWPESWFDEPAPEDMPAFGGLRITASGRITGFLAPPKVVHRAFRASGRNVTVPTRQDYSEFNNKPALVAARDGGVATINAGAITCNCGHVELDSPVRPHGNAAVREVYDNTCSIVARVRIWESPNYPGAPIVAGALLHGIDADMIERIMGSNLSGDWQAGKLSAALLVPVEGFPPSVAGSVRIKEGQMVASSVPIHVEPRVRDIFDQLAVRAGCDPASRFAQLRARVGGD